MESDLYNELRSIFGGFFTPEQYHTALSLNGYDVALAAEYLQDHLHEHQLAGTPDTEADSVELGSHSYAVDSFSDNREAKKGSLMLEFSRSPEYFGEDIKRLYVTDEALLSIFLFLEPSELGLCAMVCKSWANVETKCKRVYKEACLIEFKNQVTRPANRFPVPFDSTEVLWGPQYPDYYCATQSYIKSFKTWKGMFVTRPRVKTYGLYISRTRYWRQGSSVPGNLQPAHLVEFFRYLRFFDDFSVICLTTAKKPSLTISSFNPQHPEVRFGEYATNKNRLTVHLLAKDTIFTYSFKMHSSAPGKFDLLTLKSCFTRDLRTLEENEMSISADSFPKHYRFYRRSN
jgi:hypothetical protein